MQDLLNESSVRETEAVGLYKILLDIVKMKVYDQICTRMIKAEECMPSK